MLRCAKQVQFCHNCRQDFYTGASRNPCAGFQVCISSGRLSLQTDHICKKLHLLCIYLTSKFHQDCQVSQNNLKIPDGVWFHTRKSFWICAKVTNLLSFTRQSILNSLFRKLNKALTLCMFMLCLHPENHSEVAFVSSSHIQAEKGWSINSSSKISVRINYVNRCQSSVTDFQVCYRYINNHKE